MNHFEAIFRDTQATSINTTITMINQQIMLSSGLLYEGTVYGINQHNTSDSIIGYAIISKENFGMPQDLMIPVRWAWSNQKPDFTYWSEVRNIIPIEQDPVEANKPIVRKEEAKPTIKDPDLRIAEAKKADRTRATLYWSSTEQCYLRLANSTEYQKGHCFRYKLDMPCNRIYRTPK